VNIESKYGKNYTCFFVTSCASQSVDPKVTNKVFFDISIGDQPEGTIELGEIVQKTSQNFYVLSKRTVPEGYNNSIFHRVKKDFMIQGGDFISGNGEGGFSIYGESFPDENFILNHNRAGWLSMANAGPDTNGSQFFITINPPQRLDGKFVVFGKVLSGFDVVRKIEANPAAGPDGGPCTYIICRPILEVKIADIRTEIVDPPFSVSLDPVQE